MNYANKICLNQTLSIWKSLKFPVWETVSLIRMTCYKRAFSILVNRHQQLPVYRNVLFLFPVP